MKVLHQFADILRQGADMLRLNSEKLATADIAVIVLDELEDVEMIVVGRIRTITGANAEEDIVISLEPADALPEALRTIRQAYGAKYATGVMDGKVYVNVASGNVALDDHLLPLLRTMFAGVPVLDLRTPKVAQG